MTTQAKPKPGREGRPKLPATVPLNVRISFKLYRTVKDQAVGERKDLQELVRDALEMYLRVQQENAL